MRGNPFFRRMGCFFMIFNVFAIIGFLALIRFIFAPFIEIHGAPVSEPLNSFLPFGVGGFLILLAAIFWGVRNLRRMSMPLDELLDASNRVADGDFSARVDEKGPPEVWSLMRGFNSMAEKLEVNDKQHRNMLADISHELRSPITVIQGNLEGMIDGVYSADREKLKSLYEETQILERLVDDLRTLALAESGSLQLKREPTDLEALIRDVVSVLEAQANEKNIHIELVKDNNVEEMEIDALRIREVMMNLLTNALRYTPDHGKVKVGLTESGSSVERDELRVSKRSVMIFVQDSGEGIRSADLSHIFDRFYKSGDSGGMGLGLSIAKHLVETHGGNIWAESEGGQGATVSFTLPR
jgi:signal transduction histidine kinase